MISALMKLRHTDIYLKSYWFEKISSWVSWGEYNQLEWRKNVSGLVAIVKRCSDPLTFETSRCCADTSLTCISLGQREKEIMPCLRPDLTYSDSQTPPQASKTIFLLFSPCMSVPVKPIPQETPQPQWLPPPHFYRTLL